MSKQVTAKSVDSVSTVPAVSPAVSEVAAFKAAFAALQDSVGKLGPQGLDILARELGESVNAAGRPEFNSWVRFTLAVCAEKPSFTRQQAVFGIARGAARDSLVGKFAELKGKEALNKFCKTKTTQSQDGVTCKLVIARPAAWDIAFD